ncbi:ead/Ea22-like family protein [Escherichia coli]
MSKIDYQALREAAERAIPAMERLLMLPADDDLLSEQELKDYGVDIDALNAFKFLVRPETVQALLDELESAEKRITELEARAVTLPQYRNSPDMHTKQFYEAIGFNQGLDIFIEAIRAAGIRIKGE